MNDKISAASVTVKGHFTVTWYDALGAKRKGESIPDPVSDYERQKYPTLQEYIAVEIIPEMQKKLRQGFGRAIRTEQDSCVVAILDERAGIGGKYHDAALAVSFLEE